MNAGPGAACTRLASDTLLALTLLLALEGCRRGPPKGASPPPVPAAASSVAPDRLQPGELAEGSERAFGLTLPRGFVVRRRFADLVAAEGQAPLDSMEQYLKRRVEAGRIEAGVTHSVFDRVRLRSRPNGGGGGERATAADPDGGDRPPDSSRWLRIELLRRPDALEVVVRDITGPPDVPGLDEAERWRRAGLGPNGRQLDRSAYR